MPSDDGDEGEDGACDRRDRENFVSFLFLCVSRRRRTMRTGAKGDERRCAMRDARCRSIADTKAERARAQGLPGVDEFDTSVKSKRVSIDALSSVFHLPITDAAKAVSDRVG